MKKPKPSVYAGPGTAKSGAVLDNLDIENQNFSFIYMHL